MIRDYFLKLVAADTIEEAVAGRIAVGTGALLARAYRDAVMNNPAENIAHSSSHSPV